MEAVHVCGKKSGRDINKWAETGLHPDASETIMTPGIAECPISLECRIRHILDLGLHTMFVAEVLRVRKDPDWQARALPPVFLENKYYALQEGVFQERR
jgi:flavin reductase (DIM6/NTAB) family NADH-FMN oxidoreductase RutF